MYKIVLVYNVGIIGVKCLDKIWVWLFERAQCVSNNLEFLECNTRRQLNTPEKSFFFKFQTLKLY